MNIFVVDEKFERPVDTSLVPPTLTSLYAEDCAACHQAIYDEWKTTIHSQAWTDPYFQVDWEFDRSQQICKNCHTPLDRQQEYRVLGFRDEEKWDPILAPNPDFDPKLQHEGVTCTGCHLREGLIVGTRGDTGAPHPVKKLFDPNQVCVKCHVVEGDRWDTYFRFPPCGTVAEIRATTGAPSSDTGKTGEFVAADTKDLGCVQCHMPLVQRPLVADGEVRSTRQHLWRGGHDPEMVKRALVVQFEETSSDSPDRLSYALTVTNAGAAHYLPTGTPDRHLSVHLRALDGEGKVLEHKEVLLKRTVMWRPFIIDLWDTRLPRWQARLFHFEILIAGAIKPVAVEAVIRYHLLDERRRKRIGYENKDPISYEVFRQRITVDGGQSDMKRRKTG